VRPAIRPVLFLALQGQQGLGNVQLHTGALDGTGIGGQGGQVLLVLLQQGLQRRPRLGQVDAALVSGHQFFRADIVVFHM
jgi:hypothetical protein